MRAHLPLDGLLVLDSSRIKSARLTPRVGEHARQIPDEYGVN